MAVGVFEFWSGPVSNISVNCGRLGTCFTEESLLLTFLGMLFKGERKIIYITPNFVFDHRIVQGETRKVIARKFELSIAMDFLKRRSVCTYNYFC
jgi:hypothetical protein